MVEVLFADSGFEIFFVNFREKIRNGSLKNEYAPINAAPE
jgi:hypothetical protein